MIRARRGRSPILIGLMAAAALAGCSRRQPAASQPLRPVKTMVVAAQPPTESRTFAGRVVASKEPDLAFQVPGLLESFPVREGERVARGQVIARLRLEEFRARLAALEGQLDRARADLRALRAGDRAEDRLRLESQVRAAAARLQHAQVELDRFSDLIKENAVARSDYELVETEFRVAKENHESAIQALNRSATGREEDIEAREADVRGLEGRVQEAKIQLEDAVLRAPFDGVVAHRYVEESQNVGAGTPIVRFQDFEDLNISVDVPEAVMAADLRRQDIVRLVAEFSAVPGREFPVEIREVAQVADPTTQTFRVRLSMPAQPGVSLLPGMTAIVRIDYRSRSDEVGAVRAPISAVFNGADGATVVWEVLGDGSIARRPVKLGGAAGGLVVIEEGLRGGERIAVAGVSQLSEGMKVRDLGDALSGSGAGQP